MERRGLLAVVLSLVVLAVWSYFFAPPPPVPTPPTGATDGSVAGASMNPEESGPSSSPGADASDAAREAEPASDQASAAERRESPEGTPPTIVETDLLRVELASTGGKITSWELERYEDYEGRPYEVVSPDSKRAGSYPLEFRLEDKALEGLLNERARFVIETRPLLADDDAPADGDVPAEDAGSPAAKEPAPEAPGSVGSDGAREVRLVFADGSGLEARKTLVFRHGSYLVGVRAQITKKGEPVPGQIVWGPGVGTPIEGEPSSAYFEGGHGVADAGYGATRYYPGKVLAPQRLEGDLRWAGMEEQYFAAVFIPADGLAGTEIVPMLVPPPQPPAGTAPAKPAEVARLSIAVPLGQSYELFAGPKDFQLLEGLAAGLGSLVRFAPGVPLIGPLVGLLAQLLYMALRWLYSFIPNYGVAIIIMTTVIRIIFYPVTQRAMVKMRAVQQQMQKVQPKIKAIREKYRKAKDAAGRGKMNEEIMALYQKEGINPMASLGGCLPLLLQLPILYAFYSLLTVSIELRQAPFFGWIKDLSRQDPYYITPLLMGASMFVQQKMAMTTVTDPQQRMQQRMMLFMPFIFTFTFLNLPSGLVIYWFVNNILGIVQQVLINRQAAALDARGAAATGRA